MDMKANTDTITRSILINAPRERVWRALSDAEEFGNWFGADLKGQTFTPGQRVRGLVTACGHDNVWFDVVVERMEAPNVFSYHWHPHAVDPKLDYDREEPTLVTFTLEDAPDEGTLLTLIESGFDKVPPERRLEAFRMNGRGWEFQLKNIAAHAAA